MEIYISTDIESNGPIPGPYSMLSLASVALNSDGAVLGLFTANLKLLDTDIGGHPDTMAWWNKQPKEIWDACRKDQQEPKKALTNYCEWLKAIKAEHNSGLVFVGYPAGFDFTFVYWYLMYFTSESPFGFQALDIKSYASAVLKVGFKSTTKRTMPKRWFNNLPKHTHIALDDAKEQGLLFLNIRNENLEK